jgi:hypothetical protein
MTKFKTNLRNVVAIAICLAGVTLFSGCDKNNGSDGVDVKESWVEFAGEKYYYFFSREVYYVLNGDSHNWICEFMAGRSSTSVGDMKTIHLENWHTRTNNPNGIYSLTSSNDEINESHARENSDPNYTCYLVGPNCRVVELTMLNGSITTTAYNIISGTLDVNKNGNIWTFKINGMCKDANGNTKPFAINYRGEVTFTQVN